ETVPVQPREPVGQAKTLGMDAPKTDTDGSAVPERSPRTVRSPQVLVPDAPLLRTDEERVGIVARPSRDNRQCDFLIDRDVLPNLSWRFADADSAAGSPLAEALFTHPEVAWIQIDQSVVKIARRSGKEGDWRPLSQRIGTSIRTHIDSGIDAVDASLFEGLPDEEELVEQLQHVIDTEVNPGVAAHDGHVTLEQVRGNAVHVRMGGGCQGCSAAALTLKFGIFTSFRNAVPQLGAIYDETDHAAGLNPFHR
ncbi:MAG: NifU family protein, partial [Myxococcota bacterium]|nr:NifU family protein [Myxococcota bacterium]